MTAHATGKSVFPDALQARRRVVGHLRARRVDAATAEDLAHDAMERVLRASPIIDVRDPIGLAIRIAENLLVDQQRRSARRPQSELPINLVAQEPSPEAAASARQQLEALSKALQAMPPLRRRVFLRRRYHGDSCADIANTFGISVRGVEKHITRAMLDLEAALKSTLGEDS